MGIDIDTIGSSVNAKYRYPMTFGKVAHGSRQCKSIFKRPTGNLSLSIQSKRYRCFADGVDVVRNWTVRSSICSQQV